MAKSLSNIIRAGSPSTPLPVSFGGTGSTTAASSLTALGALPTAGGTMTGAVNLSSTAINTARSSVAQHATTMDFWATAVGNVLDGTGAGVTITAIANAPQAGASRDFYPLTGTVLTQGATFDIDGAVTRTSAAGECWTFVAKSVNTYRVFVRKADGTATVVVDGSSVIRSARTANTILAAGDSSTLIDITSGTFSQTFTAAATLGSGWWCYIRNSGNGVVTLDPNAAELIDGVATKIAPPALLLIQCDGATFRTYLIEYLNTNVNATAWINRASPADNSWQAIAWNGLLFVAVASSGTGEKVMTSPDGITWTSRVINGPLNAITWNGTTFCTMGNGNQNARSTDGVTWTSFNTGIFADFQSIAWNGTVFAALCSSGTSSVTSSNGITWTTRTIPINSSWPALAWNGTVFAAASTGGDVMTSPDGITWTSRTSAAANSWQAIAWNGTVFAAVSDTGTGDRVMTSPDGITWTSRTSAADNSWRAITWNGTVFVAVSATGTGDRVMTSPDGITWTSRTSAPSDNAWQAVAWNGAVFAAVSDTGIGNRVMTTL